MKAKSIKGKSTEEIKTALQECMSDGFPELQNQDSDMLGYKLARNSFEEVAEKDPEKIISYLNEVGSRWVNNREPEDDVTFVVIKVK